MVGSRALRRACRVRTTLSGTPLALAAFTYWLWSVSSMLDRVIREICAMRVNVSVGHGAESDGSANCRSPGATPRNPPDGSHPR